MTSQPTNSKYPDYIVVKFKDSVKLPYSDSFVQSEANLESAGLAPLNQIFHEFKGTIMQRLFSSVPPEEVAVLEENATKEPAFVGEMEVTSRRSDILSYFRILPPPSVNAQSLIERLRQFDFVEEAYIEGKPTPPPFVNQSDDPLAKFQAYEAAAPQGIDSYFAWTLRGGDGEGSMFVDLEQGWTLNHEDIVAKGITIISGVNNRFFAHGTNVLGEVVGVDNKVGIVGIGSNLDSVRVVSQWRTASNFSTADAILSATNQLVKESKDRRRGGTVLLLEAQTTVTHTMPGVHLPVEVEPAVFDAIKLAINSGVIVVEAAGNGLNNGGPGANLDQFVNTAGKRVLNRNSPDFRDSGAIVVAAASSSVPHTRMSFSNFGSRIDCYGWGENVTTTGSNKAPASPTAYTHTFSGTSSASPIIAGAALALLGISDAYLGTTFSPLNIRSMLSFVGTGTASSNPSAEKIGVMPDLRKIVTVSMGITPATILAKDLNALVKDLLGSGLIPRPLCYTFSKAMPILKAGSKGPQVEFLQRALAHIKESPGAFDGVFGEQTKAAIVRFQASLGLAKDGIVGPKTWDTICTLLSSSSTAMVLCSAFSKAMPILKAGSKGPQVEFLQRALAHIKESPGAFDGVFGEQTKAAVNRFQTSIKIYSDGIVGPDTWGALCISFSNIKKNIVFTQGSRGGEVRVLQYFLSKEDFSPGLIDGIFGDRTRNAVVQFQKSAGLIPNGIVESATWAKLLQGKLPLSSKQQERTAVAGRSTLELATLSMFQTREQKEATKNRQGIGGIEGIGVTTLQEAQNVPSLIQKLKKLGVRGGGVRTLAGLRTRLIALFRGVIGREVDMNLHVANRYLERCLTRGGALEGFTFSHLTNTLRFGKYYKDQTNGNYIAVSNIADSKRAAIVMTVRGGGGKVIFRTIEPTKQFDEPSIRFVPVRRPFEMRSKP